MDELDVHQPTALLSKANESPVTALDPLLVDKVAWIVGLAGSTILAGCGSRSPARIFLGASFLWLCPLLAGSFYPVSDPELDAPMIHNIWLVFGLPACALYATAVAIIAWLIRLTLGIGRGTPR